ncbi:CAP domain-containing protein [Streptomyces sp. NBC_01296]|uniref:CAP domain-containing protein n=1 Tax=Streptomyces sp. NBC_01296 TaxID=2903816 RepID=UPI002E110B09|nr:CAP domain-containing protein [Streptomyces sp. NBC_01296]
MSRHAPLVRTARAFAVAGILSAALVPVSAAPATAVACDAAAAARAPTGSNDSAARNAVICLINAERAQLRLPALTVNQALTNAAQQHSAAAVQLKWWGPGKDSHTNPQTGSTPGTRIKAAGYCPNPRSWGYAEITYTGWGGSGTPNAAVNWWVHVSTYGHRQIVLDPSMREIGAWAQPGAADRAGAGASQAGTYVVTFGRCVQ